MFKGMGEMLQMARNFQSRLGELKESLARKEVTGSAGAGMVEVRMNGRHQVLGVTIAPEAVDPREIGILQDLVRAATNDALARVEELIKSETAALTGGIEMPGLSGLV